TGTSRPSSSTTAWARRGKRAGRCAASTGRRWSGSRRDREAAMSSPPKTVLEVSDEEAEAIRDAVRHADPASLGLGRAHAELKHVPGLLELFADEAVSGPIYDLPRPFSEDSLTRWV